MSWLKKSERKLKTAPRKRDLPDGLWVKCEECGEILYQKELERNLWTCTKCSYHFRISARTYIQILLDEGSFQERFSEVVSTDPLKFRDTKRYADRLRRAREETGLSEAIVVGEGQIEGRPLVIGIMDFAFLGGSFASAAGERMARGILLSLEKRWPLVIISSSGGARMFEGILSLMQMAKANALLARLSDAGVPYVSVMTHPTTGGVTASFASVGDVILAEPRALIGFAGPRVIKQTINQELPEGFQRSEFLLAKGMVDQIVHRNELRKTLGWLLQFFAAAAQLPQKPRRRAGETIARFRAVGGPIASTPAPPPATPKPEEAPAFEPAVNGAPARSEEKPEEKQDETAEPKPQGSAAFPADQEIPIRE